MEWFRNGQYESSGDQVFGSGAGILEGQTDSFGCGVRSAEVRVERTGLSVRLVEGAQVLHWYVNSRHSSSSFHVNSTILLPRNCQSIFTNAHFILIAFHMRLICRRLDTGICTVTYQPDNFRNNLLYLPVGAILSIFWLGFGFEVIEPIIRLNPIILAALGAPLIYNGSISLTSQFIFPNNKIVYGPCPACETETRVYFGDILGVEVR